MPIRQFISVGGKLEPKAILTTCCVLTCASKTGDWKRPGESVIGTERGTAFIALVQEYVSAEIVSPKAIRARPTVFNVTGFHASLTSNNQVVANRRVSKLALFLRQNRCQ
jgi:hypothetical protein